MSPPVENLVPRLHAKRSGKGWIAKCPAHDDRKPSLSIDEGSDGRALIRCHAGCDNTAILASLGMKPRDLFPVTSHRQSGNGATASKPFDWQVCVEAFNERHLERLADWRGYSGEFCSWLHKQRLVGLCEKCIAFPVHDREGIIVAAHCRQKDGSWRYFPQRAKVCPLVIGELIAGVPCHVFEGQWDGFTFADTSGERDGIIITRGASNGRLVANLIPRRSTVYLWTQNDSAGEKWQQDICNHTNAIVKRAKIPPPAKDLNNWLLDLRRRKIAVVIVHHAGRSGEMRGTSKREDNVFWIIALDDRKKDADDKRGARFISHFTKPSRNTQGEVPAYEWHFVTESNQVSISHKQAQTLEVFRSVIESGVTKTDEIADAMKVPNYVVSRMAKKAMDEGWLNKAKRGEYVLKEVNK